MAQLEINDCLYDASVRSLYVSAGIFGWKYPQAIDVFSNKTGKTVSFHPVKQGHPLWDEDGWDGEQCIYVPIVDLPKCKTLIVHRADA